MVGACDMGHCGGCTGQDSQTDTEEISQMHFGAGLGEYEDRSKISGYYGVDMDLEDEGVGSTEFHTGGLYRSAHVSSSPIIHDEQEAGFFFQIPAFSRPLGDLGSLLVDTTFHIPGVGGPTHQRRLCEMDCVE